jgi:hypothetical protein
MSRNEQTMDILINALEEIYHKLGWESRIIVEGDEIIGLISGETTFMEDFGESDDRSIN